MKQVIQHLRSGVTEVADVPAPALLAEHLLIRSTRSLISAGTERMLVEFGKASMIGKARSQPEKVRQVIEKIGTDGVVSTIEAVLNKLDQPLALGYCNVGRVLKTGEGISGFAVGERVVSNGRHAEVVHVAANLCARIPDAVTDDAAAFTVMSAIALQGIRLVQPALGESVAVMGLGVIGLLTVQLLRANGCRVLAIDLDPKRLTLARGFGAEIVDVSSGADPVVAAQHFSQGRGIDAVIVAASSESSEPVHQAAAMCRKRGRIVMVGVTGLELQRSDFYEKELTFQVSCSYGPGRYDPSYEEKGNDYPIGFVRWTAQRNFEAVLDMMAAGSIDVRPLITHRFSIDDAGRAYDALSGSGDALGIMLEYPGVEERSDAEVRRDVVTVEARASRQRNARVSVAFVGSGSYAGAVLIPAFRDAGADLRTVASKAGVSGLHAGRKFGFASTTTDATAAIHDPDITAVVVATRHDSHATLASAALEAGKHVFVEKPLALSIEEIERVRLAALNAPNCIVMVGFNRRFSPHAVKMKSLLDQARGPKAFVMTVNAGAVPREHWTQDPQVGGGRIIGEACHFIDLLRFLAFSPIVDVQSTPVGSPPSGDSAMITLRFEDGSVGTIAYLATGHRSFPKERLEVFAGGRVLQLDNFRKLKAYGWPGLRTSRLWRQDKGQRACAAAFVNAVAAGAPSPIPFDEIVEVSRASIAAAIGLR